MGWLSRYMEFLEALRKKSMGRPKAPMPISACRPETAGVSLIETRQAPTSPRIVEVSFSDNADLDAAVAAPEAVIAAYATRNPRPDFDFGRCCSPT